ncbi:copper transporter [Cryptosporidium felis]|nr:copper transporter [Cryptosporidium felis]
MVRLVRDLHGVQGTVIQNPTKEDLDLLNDRSLISVAMQMTFHQSYESVILFDIWKTSNSMEYFASCLVIILFGCLTMYISAISKKQIMKLRRDKTKREAIGMGEKVTNILITLIYYSMHYLLMLIAMTFNWGLFLSVIIGLTIGYGVFELSSAVSNECNCNNEYEYPSCC